MKIQFKLALVTGVLALSATPALAADPTPGPNASLPAKAKAYGSYCEAESREHVEGQNRTPFAICVTALAKLANGITNNPREACKAESKEPVEGSHGPSPFTLCVKAGANLLDDLAEQNR